MADITKCSGEGCLLKDNCYRFTAESSDCLQSYLAEVPYDKELNTCSLLWSDKSEQILDQLKSIMNPKTKK
jgi:hypothetical protein